jgi:hypothetical protein
MGSTRKGEERACHFDAGGDPSIKHQISVESVERIRRIYPVYPAYGGVAKLDGFRESPLSLS